MMNTIKFALLFSSFLGVLCALYATLLTVAALYTKAGIKSFCSINNLFDCNYVASSGAALLFGVPLAWWAFTYYLWLISVVTLTFVSSQNHRPLIIAAFIVSLPVLVLSIFKAWQMIFYLKVICIFCILLYLANATIFWSLIKILNLKYTRKQVNTGLQLQQSGRKAWYRPVNVSIPALASALVVVFTGYYIMKMLFPVSGSPKMKSYLTEAKLAGRDVIVKEALTRHFAQPRRNIELPRGTPAFGDPQAPVTIIEFSDFQCPYCQVASIKLKELLSEFSGMVKLCFIHYPLDRSINSSITSEGHPYAGLAACAAVFASDKNKFWQFHDDLFSQQEDINPQVILRLAKKYGWNLKEFEKAIRSKDITERVKEHIKSGQVVGIPGTPAIYINGRYVEQWQDLAVLRKIVEHEIKN